MPRIGVRLPFSLFSRIGVRLPFSLFSNPRRGGANTSREFGEALRVEDEDAKRECRGGARPYSDVALRANPGAASDAPTQRPPAHRAIADAARVARTPQCECFRRRLPFSLFPGPGGLPVLLALLPALLILSGCSPAPDTVQAVNARLTLDELLSARNDLRLYDGAPPVIPHEVAGLGRENCANCHTPGAYENADRVGSPRSHPAWGDCRQCHVERRAIASFRSSAFEPLRWPARGHRQTPISPPMIPHHLQNREDCAICHIGAQAPAALRAAHGFRPGCRQCHVAMRR